MLMVDEEFAKTKELLEVLKIEGMKETHWLELAEKSNNQALVPSDISKLTLGNVFDMNVSK